MKNTIQLEIGNHNCQVTSPENLGQDSDISWENWLQFAVSRIPADFRLWTGIMDGEEHLLKAKDTKSSRILAERKMIYASQFDRAMKALPPLLEAPSSDEDIKEAERVAAEIVYSIMHNPKYMQEQTDYMEIDAILKKASDNLKENQKIVAVPTHVGDIMTTGSAFFAVVEPTNMITSDIENEVTVVCETPYWVRRAAFIDEYMNGEVESVEESLQDYDYFRIVEEIPIPRNPSRKHWQEYDEYSIVNNDKYPIEIPLPS